MSEIATLKSALRASIGEAGPDGTYHDATYAEIIRLINALAERTPMPRPIDEQSVVTGPWRSTFAQFGPRHTAGKPVAHENKLNLLTFARFPDRPVRVLAIEQEIHHASGDYNNVHFVESIDGALQTQLIVFGRYRIEADNPKRYIVDFYRIAFSPQGTVTPERIRHSFDLPADQAMSVELKPPRLSSDVVFCDADMRINFGSLGGIYVMDRVAHRGHSVAFP